MPPTRFRERRDEPAIAGEILVECPSCGACAVDRPVDQDPEERPVVRRLSCTACGHSRDWSGRSFTRRSTRRPVDDFFRVPLWLRASTRHGDLWAMNHEHLTVIEEIVRAGLRERSGARGWANRTLLSRLPRWVKAASNRDEVLRTIASMRARPTR